MLGSTSFHPTYARIAIALTQEVRDRIIPPPAALLADNSSQKFVNSSTFALAIPDTSVGHGGVIENSTFKSNIVHTGFPEVTSSQITPQQISLTHKGTTEVSPSQVGVLYTGIMESSESKVGVAQVGINQIGLIQTSATQVSTSQNSIFHLSPNQIAIHDVSFPQISTTQVGMSQVSSSQVSPIQVSTTEVDITQVGIYKTHTTQVSSNQANASQFNSIQTLARQVVVNISELSFPSSITLQQFVSNHNSPLEITGIYKDNPQTLLDPTFNLTLEITDLPTGQLAEAQVTQFDQYGRPNGGTILIDHNANGLGWFINPLPTRNCDRTKLFCARS